MKVSVWEIMQACKSGMVRIDGEARRTVVGSSEESLPPPHLTYKGKSRESCYESSCCEHDGIVAVDVMPYGDYRELLIMELTDGVICIRIGDTEISIQPDRKPSQWPASIRETQQCR